MGETSGTRARGVGRVGDRRENESSEDEKSEEDSGDVTSSGEEDSEEDSVEGEISSPGMKKGLAVAGQEKREQQRQGPSSLAAHSQQSCTENNCATNIQSVSPCGTCDLLVSAVDFTREDHFLLSVTLAFEGRHVDLVAMIDSGATGNFVNSAVVQRYGIPTEALACPKSLAVVDGRPIEAGRVTHRTENLQLLAENFEDSISLLVTSIGQHDIILGLPWLRRNNPKIDWAEKTIQWTDEPPAEAYLGQTSHLGISSMTLSDVQQMDVKDVEYSMLLHVRFKTSSDLELSVLTGETMHGDNAIPAEFAEFLDVFSKTSADALPEHTKYDHKIELEEGKIPPFGRLYNLSETELKALDTYLKENLNKGFIRTSNSPAGAPVLFVKKKDGSLRLCVDYRRLNNMTIKNRYPLPLIQESLDRLRDAKWYTKIDLRGAYNLIRIKEGDEWKTAFRTRYGLFEYTVMPFGLTNAPASFQQMINEVLRDYLDVTVIVYLDDILIFSKTREQHVHHVKAVLQRLRENRLWAKLEKCEFFKQTVEFLGYVITPTGTAMDPTKIQVVLDWPIPRTVRDIRAFLGFANFYRRFIDRYSSIVNPLIQLTRQSTPWEWTAQRQAAFDFLKQAFTSAPVLTHYDPTRRIIIETDASDFAIAGVISHPDQDDRLQPVAFYSRTLDDPERNYTICDKELLAIVDAFRQWRPYAEGATHRITVYSDHRNLLYFRTSQVLSRRQTRWSEALSAYDFEILHRAGSAMGKPDALTRRYDYREGSSAASAAPRNVFKPGQLLISDEQAEMLCATETSDLNARLIQAQQNDPACQKLLRDAPTYPDADKQGFAVRNDFLVKDARIVVPEQVEPKLSVVESLHDGPLNGHPGQAKTLAAVQRHYTFDRMRPFVNRYVNGCHTCVRDKPVHHKTYGKLQPLPVPEGPWQSISMDAIVKLPKSNGYDSILTVVCRFSKMAHFIPFTEQGFDAPALAKIFQHHIFRLHGIPRDIVSDRGATFNSKFWRAFTAGLGTQSNFSTAFHPQTDGQTERVNQIIEQYLRIACNEAQSDWADLLDAAEFQYNNQEHAATKYTPFQLVYGTHPNHPAVALPSPNPAAEDRLEHISRIRNTATENLLLAQETAKRFYDRGTMDPPDFRVGDQVWVNMKNWLPKRPSKKLDHKFAGPYKILERLSPLVYKLDLPPTLSVHPTLPVALLRPYAEGHPGQRQPMPPKLLVDNEERCVPERILDSREGPKGVEFLVKWEGQVDDENTWETYEELKHLRGILSHFRKQHPQKPFPKQRRSKATPKVTPKATPSDSTVARARKKRCTKGRNIVS